MEVNSFHFPIGNARFVPKKKFVEVHKDLNELKATYMALVDKLIENYEAHKLQMVPIYMEAAETAFLKSQPEQKEFSIEGLENEKQEFINNFMKRIQDHYPDAITLREKFDLYWDVFQVSMPEMEEADAQNLEAAELAKIEYQKQVQQKMAGFVDDVVTSLRSQATELCSKMAQSLKEGKVIHSKSIQSLKDYIENFKSLNFVGDKVVEEQLDTFKKEFLDIHDAKTINESTDLKEELGRKIHEIVEIAGSVSDISEITGQYKRKVDWD